jgi:hypothetical protein
MKYLTGFIKGVVFISILLVISVLNAKADSLHIGAVSHHISPNDDVNNSNHNLIAYSTDDFIVGTYKNSFSEQTSFTGLEIIDRHYGDINVKVFAIAHYGYRSCLGGSQDYIDDHGMYQLHAKRVCGALVPSITYTKYKIQPSFLMLGNALAFSITVELD